MKKLLFAALTLATLAGTVSAQTNQTKSKAIVVYFSQTGQQYNVGNLSEGNTEIVAKIIAEGTGADLFKIETAKPYTTSDHRTLLNEARRELEENARPALKADKDISDFETIYIGYPIWWGDLPMAVYTFIEGKNWNGKTVVPFATHEGSGLSGTESKIRSSCKGASLLKGLAIRGKTAQTDRSSARKSVQEWLKKSLKTQNHSVILNLFRNLYFGRCPTFASLTSGRALRGSAIAPLLHFATLRSATLRAPTIPSAFKLCRSASLSASHY